MKELTEYEQALVTELCDQWNPARGLASQWRKTEPLSDEFKATLVELGEKAGITVAFPVEAIAGKDAEGKEVVVQQHYVHAVRPRKAPAE